MAHGALSFVLGMPLAAAMLAACLWVAYLVARRLVPAAAPHARAAAAALAALWLAVAVFAGLAALHLFRLAVAAPLWLLGAAAAHLALDGAAARGALAGDLRAAARRARRGLVALRFGVTPRARGCSGRGLRDLVSPPLGWDAIVYHLFRPAQWIQEGRLTTSIGPDGWRFLEYSPTPATCPGPGRCCLCAATR